MKDYVSKTMNICPLVLLMVGCWVHWNRGILSAIDVVDKHAVAGVRMLVPNFIIMEYKLIRKYLIGY